MGGFGERQRVALVVALAVAIMVIVAIALLDKLAELGEPYQMTLTSVDGRNVVQFVLENRRLISPEFPINLAVNTPQTVALRSSHISIPGCVVEFFDVTFLPGRFIIRIGDDQFDVMERGIVVGNKTFAWKPR